MDGLLKFSETKEFLDANPFINLDPGTEIIAPGQGKIKKPVSQDIPGPTKPNRLASV